MILDWLFGRRQKPVPRRVSLAPRGVSNAADASQAIEVVDFVSREVARFIRPGLTTLEIERYVLEITKPTGATLYFKGYRGYPSVICLPVNDEVVHAPPSERVLREGDLLKMEFGAARKGQHAVVEWTFPVGKITEEDQSFLSSAYAALEAGLAQAVARNRVAAISLAIHQTLQAAGLSPNRDFIGYGIGTQHHMDPQIPCFSPYPDASKLEGPRLFAGQMLAILVIAHRGDPACIVDSNGRTVRTRDGGRAALFSRMIEVTKEGPRILTKEPVFDVAKDVAQ